MTSAQLAHERRSFERLPVECSVKVRRVPQYTSNPIDYSFSRDISAGGVRISTPSFFAAGDRVLLNIEHSQPLATIRTIGQVTHAAWEPHAQMWQLGIMFADMDPDTESELYQLLEHF